MDQDQGAWLTLTPSGMYPSGFTVGITVAVMMDKVTKTTGKGALANCVKTSPVKMAPNPARNPTIWVGGGRRQRKKTKEEEASERTYEES